MKAKVITALRQLRDAHVALTELFCSEFELNDTDAIRFYPYHASFDELNVPTWCDETIKELTGLIPTVVNPSCLTCNERKKVTETIEGRLCKPYYKCIAREECHELYVPFNREQIVARLLSDDLQHENEHGLENIYKYGLQGYEEMTDYEVFQYYIERVEQHASNDG